MKKIIALILTLTLALIPTLTSCSDNNTSVINVGFMSGPTGMGMAKLIHDTASTEGAKKYAFALPYSDTSLAAADLLAGKIDVACVPTNEAAKLHETDGEIVVLAINTLSSLFLLTDSSVEINDIYDLEGKTVYTCKNGTPRIIIEYLIETLGINAEVSYTVNGNDIPSPKALGEQLVAGNIDIAVVPEPIVTSSLLSIKANGNSSISYDIDLAIGEAWNNAVSSPLAMGCIISTQTFVRENTALINEFLDDYKASIEYIDNAENLENSANYIVEAEIMGKAPAAKSALNNLRGAIAYIDGEAMKEALEAFYNAIGIALPDDGFYYDK